MENSFKPDQKYFKKIIWIQLTITIAVILAVGILHLIIYLSHGKEEAFKVLSIMGGSGIILMWIFSTTIWRLWINNLEYMIYEDRVILLKGILTKTEQNIPFRAITDFALERTLFDRILKLGSIKIQTAGQSQRPTGYEGKLLGLIDYDKRHEELREKIKSLHTSSEPLATFNTTPNSQNNLLAQMLEELKEIKKNTSKE